MGHRAVAGLGLLCALLFSAVMASSASAVTGTTAFTCASQKAGTGFSDAHCTKASGSGTFGHVAIAENTKTTFHATNEKVDPTTTKSESLFLRTKQPFVGEVEITCEKFFSHGTLTNKKAANGEHFIHGEKITLLYEGCKYNKPSFCKVTGGKIEANGITSTTEGQTGKNVLFKPEVGTTFVTIKSEGFGCPASLAVEGTVRAQENGATLEYNHAAMTGEKTLTVNKEAAGLEGKATVSQAAGTLASDKTGNPITSTEVAT